MLLRSSLSTVWGASTAQSGLQRSTILAVGIQGSFNGSPIPRGFLHGSKTVEGHVFRDGNINGVYKSGEAGFEGIEVQLDDGAVVKTDKDGRFRFAELRAGDHRVSVNSVQFSTPVRMTTPREIVVDLTGHRAASADFGVVDFARLTGNVFSDLRFEGKRQLDSVPIGNVQLLLTQNGNIARRIAVSAGGNFELSDVTPGDYELAVEGSTIPANYIVVAPQFKFHIAPVSTVGVDIPLRAMRSISGHVYVRVVEGGFEREKDRMSIQTAQKENGMDRRNHDQGQDTPRASPPTRRGNNSGVIHAGLYCKPGSLKAKMCVDGAAAMVALCREHQIAHKVCLKVVVANSERERPDWKSCWGGGAANGVPGLTMIGQERLRELEPHAAGIKTLHVPLPASPTTRLSRASTLAAREWYMC